MGGGWGNEESFSDYTVSYVLPLSQMIQVLYMSNPDYIKKSWDKE